MPGRYLGGTPIGDRYLGPTPITRRYLGSELVWSRDDGGVRLRDDFNRPNAGALGPNWTDHGPSAVKAAIVNNQVRLEIPDGFLVVVNPRVSRQRYNQGVAPNVDYELEWQVGSAGALGEATYVYARLSNNAFTHGVGIQHTVSTLRFVRRVADEVTIIKDAGSFAAGDKLRLRGLGNRHILRVNGGEPIEWKDTLNTAASGANYRGLGIEVSASKTIFGPRNFSPTLNYVELR